MKTINHIIDGLNASDTRAVIYYLSRYLKQASQINDYEKDIFQDDELSEPNELIKAKTLLAIKFIEDAEGAPAAEFSDSIYSKWAKHAEDIEAALQPEASPSEMTRATEFLEAISLPATATKDPAGWT